MKPNALGGTGADRPLLRHEMLRAIPPLSCRDNSKSGRYSGRIPGFRVQSGLRRHGKKTRYSRTIPGQGKDHLPDSRSGLIMGDFLSERFLPC